MIKSTSSSSIRVQIVRHLREWHRRLGILAAFFLVFLSLTGIALNHTNFFTLAHQPISNAWLLDHYGIKAPENVRFYQQKQLSVTNNYVWLGEQLLFESADAVISMAKFQQFFIIVSASELSIYDVHGELVDKLTAVTGLPADITALAVAEDQLIINTVSGYYQSDSDLLEWTAINTLIEPTWQTPEVASEQDITRANLRYQGQFLTWERIVLDAHSGRIFGDFGVFFMDMIALILTLLSVSGIYIWIRYARSKR